MGAMSLRSFFDKDVTEFACPGCGSTVPVKTLSALEPGMKVVCPGCGRTIEIHPEAGTGHKMRKADKELKTLDKELKAINKAFKRLR